MGTPEIPERPPLFPKALLGVVATIVTILVSQLISNWDQRAVAEAALVFLAVLGVVLTVHQGRAWWHRSRALTTARDVALIRALARIKVLEERAEASEAKADERWKDTKKVSSDKAAQRLAEHIKASPYGQSLLSGQAAKPVGPPGTTDSTGIDVGRPGLFAKVLENGRPLPEMRPGGPRPGDRA